MEPTDSEYEPGLQALQEAILVAPESFENLPSGHDRQVDELLAATEEEYEPGMQGSHLSELRV